MKPRYKSRLQMIITGIIGGFDDYQKRKLDDDYQNWLPHEVYIHVSAFIYGVILGVLLTILSFAGYYLFWR